MEEVKLLDHGYFRFIESWGSDERIVEAARMSTAKGFLGWGEVEDCAHCQGTGREPGFGPNHNCRTCGGDASKHGRGKTINKPGDEKLLKYLWDNHHETPFEMAGLVIEIQAPIMVFREWHRHRTQSYNELSARYTPLPDVNYIPTPERCLMVNATNRQAQGVTDAKELTHAAALSWLQMLEDVYDHAQDVYQSGLSMGIPKELARLPVPVGRYSRMRASANLRNWLAFMTLRSDAKLQGTKAQWEIRQYANCVGKLIEEVFPRTWALFVGG